MACGSRKEGGGEGNTYEGRAVVVALGILCCLAWLDSG